MLVLGCVFPVRSAHGFSSLTCAKPTYPGVLFLVQLVSLVMFYEDRKFKGFKGYITAYKASDFTTPTQFGQGLATACKV